MKNQREFFEYKKENPLHSVRFWTAVVSVILILGLAWASMLSGEKVDSQWIGTVIALVTGTFIIGRTLRAGS